MSKGRRLAMIHEILNDAGMDESITPAELETDCAPSAGEVVGDSFGVLFTLLMWRELPVNAWKMFAKQLKAGKKPLDAATEAANELEPEGDPVGADSPGGDNGHSPRELTDPELPPSTEVITNQEAGDIRSQDGKTAKLGDGKGGDETGGDETGDETLEIPDI